MRHTHVVGLAFVVLTSACIYESARPTDAESRPSELLAEDVSQLSTYELVTLARATERGSDVLQDDEWPVSRLE